MKLCIKRYWFANFNLRTPLCINIKMPGVFFYFPYIHQIYSKYFCSTFNPWTSIAPTEVGLSPSQPEGQRYADQLLAQATKHKLFIPNLNLISHAIVTGPRGFLVKNHLWSRHGSQKNHINMRAWPSESQYMDHNHDLWDGLTKTGNAKELEILTFGGKRM